MSKDLPSIDDFGADENLPSIEDFITEEKAEELPSVEDFIEKEEEVIEEATQTIEDADGNSFAEVKDIVPPWPELVRMINDVRADIPDIPEVKYYDQELQDLAEQISKLPEVRYYDREVEAICEQIDAVREQVKNLPEVKYYDEQVDAIEDRIDSLQTDVANLPEVKYYDAEIEAICEAIDQVKASIPKFPKWVNEVNEVPDFSWIGKTFSVIDDDFIKVSDKIEGLRGKVDFELEQLSEALETKHFNTKVKIESDVKDLDEKVNTRIDEEKEKIWKELRSSSLKIWEHHKTFKDDDRKLKKQILGEYNNLKKNIDKELKEINYTSVKTDELLLKYFTELKEEISKLPEVKYYDKDIDYVKTDIKDLYKLVEDIKSSQKKLQEEQQLLSETNVQFGEDPPDTSNIDPLTPIDQNFVTLDQLQQHYKIFVQRVQYQLSSIGGGGAGFIKDLDDVDISGLSDNYILQYDAASSKWLTVANNAGAGGTWATTTVGIHTEKNVGIGTTARSDFALYVEGNQYVDGNITVGGTVTYEDVKNVDSLGIITARTGVDVLAGGINVTGVSTFSSDVSFDGDINGNVNIVSTDTGSSAGPELTLYRNSASPAPGDYLGQLMFKGENSNGGQENYAKITGKITDETLGTEDGLIETAIKGGGSFTIVSRQRSDELQLLNGVGLSVDGDSTFTGGIDVDGHTELDNFRSVGVATISTGVGTVHIGTGQTALLVDGDARITGIFTVGRSSVTIDGENNTVSVGLVTVTNSTIILGDNVTIDASASGINSAPNVLYVAKDGSDSNNGTSIDNAFLTIAGAVGAATSGTVVKVLSGNYVESNPIEIPAFVGVVGDDQRTVKVLPSNTTQDIFHVNKGCKIANMTFSGHLAPAAAVAFPTGIATNVGGGKWKGPYIQNCTSDTTTGTGIYIDGDKAVKTKSMNVDAFTQYNQGGVGVAVTNEGYAQLVSVFTICCNEAITVHKGGQADLANSNCSFGTYGLVADGVSPEQFTGIVTSSGASGQDNIAINVGAVTTRPYDGQVVYFDKLYKSVETITITSGGSGYTSTPSVTISSPSGPNGEVATAFATIENGVVTEIDIISSGSQYDPTDTVTVTISAPDSGTTATATANLADTYYTINSSTPITAGITTLTLAENLLNTVGVGSTAYFFQQSKIIASSHTFEYIGSGNDITSATPKRGGVTIQANEVVSRNGGSVIYTSTDQAGNFRIGDEFQINQNTGTISGRAFSKSLFSEMTPFILALS